MNNVPNNGMPNNGMRPPVHQQPSANNGAGMSIAALVMAIAGLLFFFFSGTTILGLFSLPLCIVSLILSIKGNSLSKAATGKGSGLAIAALVISIIGLVFSIPAFICSACVCSACVCADTVGGAADSLMGELMGSMY